MTYGTHSSRDEDHERNRALAALLAERDSVCRIVAAQIQGAGSAATEDAVDAALEQLVARGEHVGDLAYVKRGWVMYASQRLLDERRSAHARRVEALPVEEHQHALSLSARDEGQLHDRERPVWRVREIFASLRGEQRQWAEAWFDRFLSTGKQPRGIAEDLGWDPEHTKEVSRAARRRMMARIQAYASGEVCVEQRAMLDALGDATSEQLELVAMHFASCDDCRAAWRAHSRTRPRLILLPPLPLLDLCERVHDRASSALASVRSAAWWLAHRLGIGLGDGTTAAGTTLGGRAAAACVGVVCAVAAAGGGLVDVVAPIEQRMRGQTERRATRATAKPKTVAVAATSPNRQLRTVSAPPPPASSSTRNRSASDASFTPGDLPPASTATVASTSSTATRRSRTAATYTPGDLSAVSSSTATTSRTTAGRTTSSAGSDKRQQCTPGDLGC
jgi:hypothetical protein